MAEIGMHPAADVLVNPVGVELQRRLLECIVPVGDAQLVVRQGSQLFGEDVFGEFVFVPEGPVV
jgi:hypothetical protein